MNEGGKNILHICLHKQTHHPFRSIKGFLTEQLEDFQEEAALSRNNHNHDGDGGGGGGIIQGLLGQTVQQRLARMSHW